MEDFRNLTAQHLTLLASAALLAAGSLLSTGSRLGYLPLFIGIASGWAALAKSARR